MSKELDYTLHPKVTYLKWAMIYLLLLGMLAVIFFLIAGRIHTYSIPVGSFQLAVPYGKYVVGDTVTFTLKNNFNSTVYVADECPGEPLAVYRLEGSTWVRVHDETSVTSCESKDRQIAIPPNTERAGSFAAWKNLFATPGKYRVVAYVDYFDAMPYQDFEVVAAPAPVAATPIHTQTSPSANVNTTPTASPTPTVAPQQTFSEPNESGTDD